MAGSRFSTSGYSIRNLNHFYKYFKQYMRMPLAAYMKKMESKTEVDLAEKGIENGEKRL